MGLLSLITTASRVIESMPCVPSYSCRKTAPVRVVWRWAFNRCVASFISPACLTTGLWWSSLQNACYYDFKMAISLRTHITSIYATTGLRDFLKPIEVLRQPSPHASYTQIRKGGIPNTSSTIFNTSLGVNYQCT